MPTFVITAPDGKEYEVTAPEGATQDQVLEYAKSNYKGTSEPAPAATPEPQKPSIVESIMRGSKLAARALVTGASAPVNIVADGLAGAANAGLNLIGSDARVPYLSQQQQQGMDNLGIPKPQTLAEKGLSGGIEALSGAGATNALVAAPLAAARAGAAAFPNSAAAAQRVQGLAALDTYTAPQVASVAAGGATAPVAHDVIKNVTGSDLAATAGAMGLSTLFGALAGKGAQMYEDRGARSQLLTMDEVRQRARDNYATLDSSGVTLRPQWVNAIIDSTERSLTRNERYDPALNPQVAATFQAMRNSVAANGAAPVSFMEEMRKRAQDLRASTDPRTQALGSSMITELDRYFNNLPQAALNTGNVADVRQVSEAVANARRDWRNLSRAETIEELMRKADITSDRPTAAQAEQFRQQLVTFQKNPRNLAPFTEEERDAIRNISRDGLFTKGVAAAASVSPNRQGLLASGAKGGLATAVITGQYPYAAGITALMGAGWTADQILKATKNAAGVKLIQDLANGTVRPPPPGEYTRGLFGGMAGLQEEK